MIRKIAMLGLAACFLALGACDDLCGGCDDAAPVDGAALQAEDGGESCGDCLSGCDEGGLAADSSADAMATDGAAEAAPATCPVSGTAGEGVCGVVDKENCGMAGDCSTDKVEKSCETQCGEEPASPKVSD